MRAPLAIITGASSGIGREVARAFAARRWRTIVLARREAELRELAEELTPLAPCVWEALDLADVEAVEPALGRLMQNHGAPDVLVNNAGYGLYKPFLSHSVAEHERMMNVLYFAPLRAIRAVLPHMLAREPGSGGLAGARGHVINISSMSVRIGPWGHSGYAAAKSALRTLTQTLAAEHRRDLVRFSVVCPGIVDTPYFTTGEFSGLFSKVRGRAISPQRVARETLGLLDRPRLEACVPGHYRALDLLAAVFPTLAHRIVASQSGGFSDAQQAPPAPRAPVKREAAAVEEPSRRAAG